MSNFPDKINTELEGYAPTVKRLRQISRLLDNAITIPGTQVGIGLDPLMGLLPIGGDMIGLMFSIYIIIESARLGVSKSTIGRMIVNIIIDGLVGAIPMLGDIFDVAWTANKYNMKMLEEYLQSPGEKKQADQGFILLLFLGLILLAIGLISLPVLIIGTIWKTLFG